MSQLYRMYKTQFAFKHKLEDKPEVVDKACLLEHVHEEVPLIVKVKDNGTWLDFKEIKRCVELSLIEFKKNIGAMDTETLAKSLANVIAFNLGVSNEDVQLQFWETTKYGMCYE